MTVESFEKMVAEHSGRLLREQYQDEIERAVRNVKRTSWDKRFRREWYRGTARIGWRHRKEGSRRRQRPWDPVGAKVKG